MNAKSGKHTSCATSTQRAVTSVCLFRAEKQVFVTTAIQYLDYAIDSFWFVLLYSNRDRMKEPKDTQ